MFFGRSIRKDKSHEIDLLIKEMQKLKLNLLEIIIEALLFFFSFIALIFSLIMAYDKVDHEVLA